VIDINSDCVRRDGRTISSPMRFPWENGTLSDSSWSARAPP